MRRCSFLFEAMKGRGRGMGKGKDNDPLGDTTDEMFGCSNAVNWRGNYQTLWGIRRKNENKKNIKFIFKRISSVFACHGARP